MRNFFWLKKIEIGKSENSYFNPTFLFLKNPIKAHKTFKDIQKEEKEVVCC